MLNERDINSLSLFDIHGSLVRIFNEDELKDNLLELNVADIPAGVYYINLLSEKGSLVRKLVVIE